MKKIITSFLLVAISFVSIAQQGYRYDVVPGLDNTYSLAHKEIKAIPYAATKTVAPTMEETVYNFATLSGAITISATITPCYTGDKMVCLFNANGSDRVVTFSTGFSAAGTLTVPASSYTSVMFVFNGVAWFELSRQNLVSGSVTTLLAGNGTVGAPSISFTSDTDNGLYRIGTNNIGVAAAGAKVLDVSATGLGVTGRLTTTVGTVRKATSTAFTGNATVTAAQLSGGLLTVTSGTDTLTLPTATLLATELGAAAGTIFEFSVLNIASGGTALITVGAGIVTASAITGGDVLTLANSATVGAATFRITFLSATAATLSRIN